MFKNSMVHLLPTKEAKDCLYKNRGTNKLNYHKGYLTQDYLNNSLNSESFHIYITSDDKPTNGEWFYDTRDKYISNNSLAITQFSKKIIATTDSLHYHVKVSNRRGLNDVISVKMPQPSISFIKKYIEEYNKSNIIIDVLVEYEEYFSQNKGDKLTINAISWTVGIAIVMGMFIGAFVRAMLD